MKKKPLFTLLFATLTVFMVGCSDSESPVSDNSNPNTVNSETDIYWVSVSEIYTNNPGSEDKPFTLLYFTDDSCADGLLMDFYTFTDETVIGIINQNYNPARISTSDDSLIAFYDSTMTGNELFQLYNLVGVPSFLILDSENRYYRRIQAGYYPAEEFGQILSEAAQ